MTESVQLTNFQTIDASSTPVATSTAAKNVLPIQSSASAYYPTAADAAAVNSAVASTGFITLSKPSGTGAYNLMPTGYPTGY